MKSRARCWAPMRALLELVLPPCCPGCGREGALLCDGCAGPLWRRLGEPPGIPLGLPGPMPDGLLQLEWCATYSGPVRAALQAFKYRGERRLVEPLADALAARWRVAGRGGEVLTWVPVHESRRRERGFDQAEQLAIATATRLALPAERYLERRQRTVAQHALGQAQRVSNTRGAFEARVPSEAVLAGRWVIVVDDILTTGASLAGCAAALLAAGATGVSGLTVARDR